jgi:hypothetical protein
MFFSCRELPQARTAAELGPLRSNSALRGVSELGPLFPQQQA